MKFIVLSGVLLLAFALLGEGNSSCLGGRASAAMPVQDQPTLTQEVFDNFVFYWESLLDLKFTAGERDSLKRGLVAYWKTNNTTAINKVLEQAGFAARNRDEASILASMREAYQASSIAELRKETDDPVAAVLVRAFDRVHGFGVTDDRPARSDLPAQGSRPGPASNSFRGYRAGRYEGTAQNTTAHQSGNAVFEIINLDPSNGRVEAHFVASNGLVGEGWLSGGIDEQGRMTLSGNLSEWKMFAQAKATGGGGITATYRLEGPSHEEGEFRVDFRGAASPVLAEGNPPLTQEMVDKFLAFYEFILDLKFSTEQRDRLQGVMVEAWRKKDRRVMDRVVGDVQYVNSHPTKEEVKARLSDEYQVLLVSGMRQALPNPLLSPLVEAFDEAHPDRREATRAKGLADLIGTWEWHDALPQQRDPYSGAVSGIGYVDGGKLEIAPDGQFKLLRTHRHCEGACCREEGKSESGTVSIEQGALVFQVKTGTEIARDGCNAQFNRQAAISPHRESYSAWNINHNPAHNNAPTLCWSTAANEPVCYVKQQ